MMKKALLCVACVLACHAEITMNDIEGIWEIPEEIEGNVSIGEIFIRDDKAYVYAFEYATKVGDALILRDYSNEESDAMSMRNTIFIAGLSFEDGKYVDGKIYRPSNGSTYYVSAELSEDKNTLELRASLDKWGIFGKTLQWNRLPDNIYTPPNREQITIADGLE